MSKKVIVSLLVIIIFLLIIFFFPKKCGTGMVITGFAAESCDCFGFKKYEPQCMCYGIPFGCKTTYFLENNQGGK